MQKVPISVSNQYKVFYELGLNLKLHTLRIKKIFKLPVFHLHMNINCNTYISEGLAHPRPAPQYHSPP